MAEYFYGEHQLTRKYLGPKWVAKIRKIKASCSKAFFRIFGTTVVLFCTTQVGLIAYY